jgi:hypothetical protein
MTSTTRTPTVIPSINHTVLLCLFRSTFVSSYRLDSGIYRQT